MSCVISGLAGISFSTKSRIQQLIESSLKNTSYALTPGLNRALALINTAKKDIWVSESDSAAANISVFCAVER